MYSPVSSVSLSMYLTSTDNSESDEPGEMVSKNIADLIFDKFGEMPPLPGLVNNFVVMFHPEWQSLPQEQRKEKSKNADRKAKNAALHDELDEVEGTKLAKEVRRYLIDNGLNHVQIQSNFSGIVTTVLKSLSSTEEEMIPVRGSERKSKVCNDSVDATVVLLFPVMGYYRQENLTSIIRQAVVASKFGVVVIGSKKLESHHLIEESSWFGFIKFATERELIKERLEICCLSHEHQNKSDVVSAQQLQYSSPLGGCRNFCGSMSCGHACPFPCHPFDRDHRTEDYRCNRRCERSCARANHKCLKQCWEECRCEVPVRLERPCKHMPEDIVLPCYEAQLQETQCRVPVDKSLRCGHRVVMECSQEPSLFTCQQEIAVRRRCNHIHIYKCKGKRPEDDDEAIGWEECKVPAVRRFPCGHRILMTCHELESSNHHLKCQEICNKKMPCGHICERRCHPEEDPDHILTAKCNAVCTKKCPRGRHPCAKKHPCSEPCAPCQESYDYKLVCGHSETITCCQPNINENVYFCKERCTRMVNNFCRHTCAKLCGDDCGMCETRVTKTIPGCSRRHQVVLMCFEPIPKECHYVVPYPQPTVCGHTVFLKCQDADALTQEEVTMKCDHSCEQPLTGENQCGHVCSGNCKSCRHGRFHVRCREPCTKTLICGHSCPTTCSLVCPPCPLPCIYSCEHNKCEYECGVPCKWTCEEPCPYQCEHSRCTKTCSQVCNKDPCQLPCQKALPCGHLCVGYCGELCPPLCRTCDPEKLLPGLLTLKSELEEEDRFVYLPDCGHCIEGEAMDTWMDVQSEEILPKRCPICGRSISWIRRYSAVMHENRKLVDSVRERVFGNVEEIRGILHDVLETIQLYSDHAEASEMPLFCDEYADFIYNEAVAEIFQPPTESRELASIGIDKAKFLQWICDQWTDSVEAIRELQRDLPERVHVRLADEWRELLTKASRRCWPLHPNEINSFLNERKRLDDAIQFYYSIYDSPPETRGLIWSPIGVSRIEAAEKCLWRMSPYNDRLRQQFHLRIEELKRVTNYTLQITEEERSSIVSAFGQRSGRWFKCVNGHVYVITECGGATERSKCSECGAAIGGENHVLDQENYLASEMDGAEAPLYPTALDRN